jgi:hypothetical protein
MGFVSDHIGLRGDIRYLRSFARGSEHFRRSMLCVGFGAPTLQQVGTIYAPQVGGSPGVET